MNIIINLFLAVIVLGLLSKVLWWIGKIHLFGIELGMTVKRRIPLWWEKGIELLSFKPPEPFSLLGVLSMPLWPSLICLNTLLLAQVLELVIPGGKRIPLSWFGSYSMNSLVAAILLAMVQVVFGLVFERSKYKGRSFYKESKFWLGVIIVAAIIVEGGLAAVRAQLLSIGEEMVSPTMWDMVMLRGGPILAGFIGFIFPVAHILVGAIAYKEGLEPLYKAPIYWIGGIISLLWCAITWWIFGHQSFMILPTSIAFLKEELEKVENGFNTLKVKSGALREDVGALNNRPKDLDSLSKEAQKIEDNINEKNGIWNKGSDELAAKINNAGSLAELEALKRKEMRKLKAHFSDKAKGVEIKIDLLYDAIKDECENLRKWINASRRCGDMLREIEDEGSGIKTIYEHLNKQAGEINLCFGEQTSFKADGLTEPQIKELIQLKRRAMDETNPSERDRSLKEMNGCIAVTNEIKRMLDKMNGVSNIIEQAKARIPVVIPALPTKSGEKDLRAKVLQLEDDIIRNIKEKKQRYQDLKRDLKSKCFQLGMPWYRRIFVLLLLTILPFLNSCEKVSTEIENIKRNETPHFIIVLLDETGSFTSNNAGVNTPLWPELIPWVNTIVDGLQPGEGFGVIGIDDHGFDAADDIRISLEVLDENPLNAIKQKNKIKKMVKELKRREGAKATDILGALSQAASLSSSEKYQYEIAIFSDMQQTAKTSIESVKKFAKDTKIYCFYVNATGTKDWDKLINYWTPIFKGLNLNVLRNNGKLHFYQRGETKLGFENAFGSR